MNPYKTPSSELEVAPSSRPALKRTIFVLVAFVMLSWLLVFEVCSMLVPIFGNLIGNYLVDSSLLLDALITFILLNLGYSVVIRIKGIHTKVVMWGCASFFFLYWGIESEAFWNGLHPSYPAWYELNMALNDVVVATIFTVVNNNSHKPTALSTAA